MPSGHMCDWVRDGLERPDLRPREVLFKCLKAKALESLVFKEDGCVSVRDTARDVVFVNYLKVKRKFK